MLVPTFLDTISHHASVYHSYQERFQTPSSIPLPLRSHIPCQQHSYIFNAYIILFVPTLPDIYNPVSVQYAYQEHSYRSLSSCRAPHSQVLAFPGIPKPASVHHSNQEHTHTPSMSYNSPHSYIPRQP